MSKKRYPEIFVSPGKGLYSNNKACPIYLHEKQAGFPLSIESHVSKTMGWIRTLLLGDIGNRLDIADTESDIQSIRKTNLRAKSKAATSSSQLARLRKELEQQKQTLDALLHFLEEKGIMQKAKWEECQQQIAAEH